MARQIERERRLGEMLVFRKKILRSAVDVGEIAASATGDEDLESGLAAMLKQGYAPSALPCRCGAHEARRARAQNDDIELTKRLRHLVLVEHSRCSSTLGAHLPRTQCANLPEQLEHRILIHCFQETSLPTQSDTSTAPATWKTLLAFAIIYFVWGSTFLAIRVGVHEVPPLSLAAMRFFAAGLALVLWMLARGERLPTRREWMSASLLAFFIFVMDYGLLFWAEQRVPSGIAAVMLATIPGFMALSEILILRTQRLTARLGLSLLIGLGGVAVLMSHSFNVGGAPIDTRGALALLCASVSWSVASVGGRKLTLPKSKVMSSGSQMLAGGVMLTLASAAFGEFKGFNPAAVSREAWFSLLYLIVFGSIIGFTAYVWLMHHQSPTKVGTYAYVNPVVAVLVGYFLGGEALGLRTILGTVFVLLSVVIVTTTPRQKPDSARN